MQRFISCDWGTSALRLRLIDVDTASVIAGTESSHGIADTFAAWQKSGKGEYERLSFYQSVLTGDTKNLEQKLALSLEHVPFVISGMASSSIGMMELPYKEVPCSVSSNDLYVKAIHTTAGFNHAALLVSGLKNDSDVMRGEETQLLGCVDDSNANDHLFIFPGTHSKHILVRDARVLDFKTYMTGEFFELLSKQSILANAVEKSGHLSDAGNLSSFEKGINDANQFNILHGAFLARTNRLFNKLSGQENYFYLSGLLIGSELKDLADHGAVTIAGNQALVQYYSMALQKRPGVRYIDVEEATVRGHCKIYRDYYSKLMGI